MKRILVTGGAGFIGSNFIRYLLQSEPDIKVLNMDKLTYAGNLENLSGVDELLNYKFYRGDISSPADVQAAFNAFSEAYGASVEAVVHFAAESHVDRSIEDPSVFLRTNVIGTQVMLEVARRHQIQKFVHVSTDEVYGTLGETGLFTEETPLAPNSPYSASKTGSDLIARAYHHTYSLPVVITRCSNNYGPYQFLEKLIPLMISNALENKPLPVYGDGLNVRDWIHVDDHNRGVWTVLQQGRVGEVYNLGGRSERTNIEVVRTILRLLGKPESLIRYVQDRLGHDLRYAIDCSKAEQELGWAPRWTFEDGIKATIDWYLANRAWMDRVRSGEYRDYYERTYDSRTV